MALYPTQIEYSDKYEDDVFEYRHVLLPKHVAKDYLKMARVWRLLEEDEWRQLGVRCSRGWEHYDVHPPEPHILLFRRVLGTDSQNGLVPNTVITIKQVAKLDVVRCWCNASQPVDVPAPVETNAGKYYQRLANELRDAASESEAPIHGRVVFVSKSKIVWKEQICATQYPLEVTYSTSYHDAVYEYRHVFLPRKLAEEHLLLTCSKRLLDEDEWHQFGIRISGSEGWKHYMVDTRQPHVLLFRRVHGANPEHLLQDAVFSVEPDADWDLVRGQQMSGRSLQVLVPEEPYLSKELDDKLGDVASDKEAGPLSGSFVFPYYPSQIEYSEKYIDAVYEYRHVFLPKDVAMDCLRLTGGHQLLEEDQWRQLGIQASKGWRHYRIHKPEPHILSFRRLLCMNLRTSEVGDVVFIVERDADVDFVHCRQLSGRSLQVPVPEEPDAYKYYQDLADKLRDVAEDSEAGPIHGRLVFLSGSEMVWKEG